MRSSRRTSQNSSRVSSSKRRLKQRVQLPAGNGAPPQKVAQTEAALPALAKLARSGDPIPELEAYYGTFRDIERFPRDDVERQVAERVVDRFQERGEGKLPADMVFSFVRAFVKKWGGQVSGGTS